MIQQTDYTKQAEELLQSFGVTFKSELIGSGCPTFCDDARKGMDLDKVNTYPRKTHTHGKQYRCTFQRVVLVPAGGFASEPYQKNDVRKPPLVIDFWNSYADEETIALGVPAYRRGETTQMYGPSRMRKPSEEELDAYGVRNLGVNLRVSNKPKVTAYDVLACLTKSEPGTFEEFCSDFGYDSDSRRAEEVWRAVREEWRKVSAFFAVGEIEKLQEVQ